MAIAKVQLPDGRIARFEVPDGTSPEQVEAFAAQQFGISPQPAQPQQISQEQAIAAGLAQRPTATQASQQTLEGLGLDPNIVRRGLILPIGRTREGDVEFALPEIALDIARALLLPGEVVKGAQVTPNDLAIFTGSFGPGALRNTAASLLKKGAAKAPLVTKEGRPTRALQEALKDSGTKFSDLNLDATETISRAPSGTDPEQAARAARFQSQGIPATRGDITQQFAQQAEEARLVSMAADTAGEPLRQIRLDQSEAFKAKVTGLVDSLGVPAETGDSIKAALSGRKKLLTQEKNRLYKNIAEVSPEAEQIPIFTNAIEDAVPDKRTSRRIGRLVSTQVDAVDDLLVEFGINKSDEALDAFGRTGGEVTPLSLGNFEEFRQALNQIERSDTTGAIKVITGPIKQTLDEEASFIQSAFTEAGIDNPQIVSLLQEARRRVVNLKQEFSPQAITGRLIGTRRDGIAPIIESSKVANQLLRPTAPIEDLTNTLKSLRGAGEKGQKAIQDLQASVIMDALENALKAPSRKTSGIETIGGNQFANALTKFGDDKLELLFKTNPKVLRNLKGLKQTALDISPTAGAVPRGSAPVILDIVKKAGRLPGLAAVVDVATFITRAGADDRAVRRALNAKPELVRSVRSINREFPEIAQRLGIVGILEEEQQ